jgi:hypothetical protein
MAFDATAALEGMVELVKTIPGMESVILGAPESPPTRILGWVMLGDSRDPEEPASSRVTGVYEDNFAILVYFGYVVEGSESAAEAQLGDYKSELKRRIILNRMNSVSGSYNGAAVTVQPYLNGSVSKQSEPVVAEGTAGYQMMGGIEVRVYPFGIVVQQRENLGV